MYIYRIERFSSFLTNIKSEKITSKNWCLCICFDVSDHCPSASIPIITHTKPPQLTEISYNTQQTSRNTWLTYLTTPNRHLTTANWRTSQHPTDISQHPTDISQHLTDASRNTQNTSHNTWLTSHSTQQTSHNTLLTYLTTPNRHLTTPGWRISQHPTDISQHPTDISQHLTDASHNTQQTSCNTWLTYLNAQRQTSHNSHIYASISCLVEKERLSLHSWSLYFAMTMFASWSDIITFVWDGTHFAIVRFCAWLIQKICHFGSGLAKVR